MNRILRKFTVLTGILLILTCLTGPAASQPKDGENPTGAGNDIEVWNTKGDVTKIEGNTIYINQLPYLVDSSTKFYSAEDKSIYFSDIKEIDVVLVRYYYKSRSAEDQRPILVEVRVSPPL